MSKKATVTRITEALTKKKKKKATIATIAIVEEISRNTLVNSETDTLRKKKKVR